MVSGMVKMKAPVIPRTSPMIYIHDGASLATIAVTTVTIIVCVLTSAELGPIGAPVEKHAIMKTQPNKLNLYYKSIQFNSIQKPNKLRRLAKKP